MAFWQLRLNTWDWSAWVILTEYPLNLQLVVVGVVFVWLVWWQGSDLLCGFIRSLDQIYLMTNLIIDQFWFFPLFWINDLFDGFWPAGTRSHAPLDMHPIENALKQIAINPIRGVFFLQNHIISDLFYIIYLFIRYASRWERPETKLQNLQAEENFAKPH